LKACVVGGSGFMGSHVCDHLSDHGHKVRIFDKMESTWRHPDQEMIIGDILHPDHLLSAIDNQDVVFNFAGLSDLEQGLKDPAAAANLNIIGNINVLNACREASVKRYVYASTVYVHSQHGGFYRCSKQAAEQFIEEFQKSYGLDFTILRYGSLYGPRSDNHNGLFRVVRDALMNGYVSYKGHRDTMREYVHVDDAAAATVTTLDDSFSNHHVVVTGQEAMKVEDLLKMLAEILDYSQDIKFVEDEQPPGHYLRTPYAYSKRTRIGKKFIPPLHVDLGQGLVDLIEYVSNMQHETPSKDSA
jgi:UDP-glucose 4-epimerase